MKKVILLAAFFLLLFCAAPKVVSANEEFDYVLDSSGRRVPIPITYDVEKVFKYFGEEAGQMSNPQDLFIDGQDNIYVVDTGNSRILKLNRKGEVLRVFKDIEGTSLNEPEGIYVDNDGDMFIADTGNGRVVHISSEGKYVEQFVKPESKLYDDSYKFRPVKVYVDQIGQLYIINKEDYHGFIVMDALNQFKGYVAPTKLEFSLMDQFIKLFASAEQKTKLGKRMPPIHTNFVIDENATVYVTTMRSKVQQFKRFSTVGSNIYPKKDAFGETTGDYILTYFGRTEIEPRFVDVCVDENGIASILDNTSGRIYQYDSDGLLLTVFGGTGNWAGKFINAVSIARDKDGKIYVLDANVGAIHVFRPTSFINMVHHALQLYYGGKYEEATGPWMQILNIDKNYPVAHVGMGKAYLKRKQWLDAMKEFKAAENKAGYSEAFNGYRHEMFRKYFGWILLAVILLLFLLVRSVMYLRRQLQHMY